MTMQAHFPPFETADWMTIHAAVAEYGVPVELIHGAMLGGELTVRSVAGKTIVNRAEIKAMRLRLMANRGCDGCDE